MAGKFFQALRELRAGTTLDELDSALAEVVHAVKTTGRPGELILKLKIRPPKKATANYLSIEDDVVTKVPKQDRADTIFFPLSDNSLSRNDPNQRSLDLRSVVSTPSVAPERVDSNAGQLT
jgi:hypothetical protein